MQVCVDGSVKPPEVSVCVITGVNKKQTNDKLCGHITLALIQELSIETCLGYK